MPFIPRLVKEPPPFVLTCRLPQAVGASLKQYVEFMECPREYVIIHILQRVFRQDKEFRAWLPGTHPKTARPATESLTSPADASGRAPASTDIKTAAVPARRLPTAPAPHPSRTDHEPLAREDRTTS